MTIAANRLRTYKEVVGYFETLSLSHLAVKQFQSGVFSDIDVQTEDKTPTKYPLCFLVYRDGSIESSGKTVFNFTFIVGDIARDQESLEINRLSDCHEILQDIISKIKLTSYEEVGLNIELPITTNPFTQAYNNGLSGWAAELAVSVISPMNLCEAAFE